MAEAACRWSSGTHHSAQQRFAGDAERRYRLGIRLRCLPCGPDLRRTAPAPRPSDATRTEIELHVHEKG